MFVRLQTMNYDVAKSPDRHCMQILGSLTHKGVSGIHSYILIQVEVIGGAIDLGFPLSIDEKFLPPPKYVNVKVGRSLRSSDH